jgi:thiamine kinase-like enzyme
MDKGFLSVNQLVDGNFRVDTSDSRNKNFIINKDFDNAYFIKHVRQFDGEKTSTLRTEATCYWLANNDDHYVTLKSFLPAYYTFDYINYILVLGYEKENISLYDFYQQKGIAFDSIADKLGVLLSSYHKEQSTGVENEAKKFFKRQKPWVFSLGDAERFVKSPTNQKAQQQVIKLVLENKQYNQLIRGLEEQWVYTSLIHNDIKFQNLLINSHYNEGNDPAIKLIDWELADIGDPCWDVAALFQSYLTLWVMYETANKQGQDFSLSRVQPFIRAFWHAYVQGIGMDKSVADEQLLKSIHFCALKLIHSSLETTTGAENLSPYGAKLLQLSFNILRSPKESRYNLFGIH